MATPSRIDAAPELARAAGDQAGRIIPGRRRDLQSVSAHLLIPAVVRDHVNHPASAEAPPIYRERDEPRYPLRIRAFLTSPSGEELMLDLLDISRSGFAARSLTSIAPGSRVFLALPGTAAAEAEVVWNIGCTVGGRFLPKLPFTQVAALLQELGGEAAAAADVTGRFARGR